MPSISYALVFLLFCTMCLALLMEFVALYFVFAGPFCFFNSAGLTFMGYASSIELFSYLIIPAESSMATIVVTSVI